MSRARILLLTLGASLISLLPVLPGCGARSDLLEASGPGATTTTTTTPTEPPPPLCTADGEPCATDIECCVGLCTEGTCGACRAGEEPVVLAAGEDTFDTIALALDRTSVYWASGLEGGRMRRINKHGGEAVTLATGLGRPFVMELDEPRATLYFTAEDGVYALPTSGGEAALLADSGEAGTCYVLTQDADALYWTSYNTESLRSMPKDGGPVTLLADTGGVTSGGIAVDEDTVYWSGYLQLFSTPKAGGALTPLTDDHAYSMSHEAGRLFYSTGCAGNCGHIRALSAGGGVPESLTGIVDNPLNMALDGEYVYWAWQDNDSTLYGGVRKVAKSGGQAWIDVAQSTPSIMLRVDETCAYWMTLEGEILRAHK